MNKIANVPHFDIIRKPFEVEMVDVMGGDGRWEIPLHDHSLVALVDVMPRLVPKGKTADFRIVQAARVSYGEGTKKVSEDAGLVRYLRRHRHTTPSEMVEFVFHQVMPIFVARQWIRHRTANVNEYSARYSLVKDRFFHPTAAGLRKQSLTNKQGGTEPIDEMTAAEFEAYLIKAESLYQDYESLVEKGVSRELARIGLPLSVYTEWYWKIDLHNLLHFLGLRMDSHAQQEIQDCANSMYRLIEPIVPISCQAFVDYQFEAFSLTRLEIEAIANNEPLATTNARERAEFAEKMAALKLTVPQS